MSNETIANHSGPLKLDLQYFADEDYILPDDFEADLPESDEIVEDELLDQEPTGEDLELESELDEGLQQEQEEFVPPPIKVKFNHEEQEIGYDDAVPLIQKGMNYDKLQERLGQLESDPRIRFVDELAQSQGMSTEQYLEAVRQAQEQRQMDELVQQNIPEEYAREIFENRKFREQFEAEQMAKQQEETRNKEFNEFFEVFKQANDRNYDPSKDEIPQEVWSLQAQGVPLKYAYMQHHNNQLKSQIQTLKQNEQNTKRAPIGSLTAFGGDEPSSEDDFLKGFNSI